ncbi:MAG TPA: DUF2283 domain-containing protein [Chloroflexota bacterium]|jgi:uncharacterized protein YuzE|nr:DUF2283 domain-containing protein [Chloroflexota bacterium]
MEAVRMLEGRDPVTRTYDEDADVLYISLGAPRAAVGVDVGDGVILRYDEAAHEVVGVTLVGMRARLLRRLSDEG